MSAQFGVPKQGGTGIPVFSLRKAPIWRNLQHHEGIVIEICGELMPVIELLQHYAVAVDHTVRGDRLAAAVDQQQGGFGAVQVFQLLRPGAAAIQVQKMAAPYGFQIGKVCNDRGLLAAEREIDEVFNVG